MAKRKKKRQPQRRKDSEYPGWVWMIFGLAIGLSVAFAVYVNDREPMVSSPATEPASLKSTMDDNGETAAGQAETEAAEEPIEDRFDFYKMLPAFEMVVEDQTPNIDRDVEPQAVDEPGVYLLQAGSFSSHPDADRRRAELALHGIESRVQRARVNDRDYFRVYIGPIEDLDELNLTRSRLRAAEIDVMRIRLGD